MRVIHSHSAVEQGMSLSFGLDECTLDCVMYILITGRKMNAKGCRERHKWYARYLYQRATHIA